VGGLRTKKSPSIGRHNLARLPPSVQPRTSTFTLSSPPNGSWGYTAAPIEVSAPPDPVPAPVTCGGSTKVTTSGVSWVVFSPVGRPAQGC
jgi:hypothetical protein